MMPYTDEEANFLQSRPIDDDRCAAGRLGVHCSELNKAPRLQRMGFENIHIKRVRANGVCRLIPIHADGTEGQGFDCTNGEAAWQIAKLRIGEEHR